MSDSTGQKDGSEYERFRGGVAKVISSLNQRLKLSEAESKNNLLAAATTYKGFIISITGNDGSFDYLGLVVESGITHAGIFVLDSVDKAIIECSYFEKSGLGMFKRLDSYELGEAYAQSDGTNLFIDGFNHPVNYTRCESSATTIGVWSILSTNLGINTLISSSNPL